MADEQLNPKVDAYIARSKKWPIEYERLRSIALSCQLTEELKWGVPCYTLQQKNIVLIHGFKDYCAILFHKGSLLKDTHNILIQQTENVQAARQIRFANIDEVIEKETIVKAYIYEAMELEKSGAKVEYKKQAEMMMPEELEDKFNEAPEVKIAFEALTPGRQKAYIYHFNAAKQSKTRVARIEKAVPQILDGKGLND